MSAGIGASLARDVEGALRFARFLPRCVVLSESFRHKGEDFVLLFRLDVPGPAGSSGLIKVGDELLSIDKDGVTQLTADQVQIPRLEHSKKKLPTPTSVCMLAEEVFV
jgi:hypothetical protein